MSTRPRISFDEKGRCSACLWKDYQKSIDWSTRTGLLQDLLDKYRGRTPHDCIVAVSGGKDGSYVAYNLRQRGMNPLTVTVRPSMETSLGRENLDNFIESGFSNLFITPDPVAMKVLNKIGLYEMGFSYYGWLIAIHSVVLRIAMNFKIPLIFYSEDGECEYGGDMHHKDNGIYGSDYMVTRYMESGYERVIKAAGLNEGQLYWFKMPTQSELNNLGIQVTHWGFYEEWDPYRNYQVAKKYCGLQEAKSSNVGTFTNFAQTDQDLYPLHVYLMYLKFGFGRATQDAGIDVRRGAMTRSQAVNLVRMYDDIYPQDLFDAWCRYYQIDMNELQKIFDKWVNKDLFYKEGNRWRPNFSIT